MLPVPPLTSSSAALWPESVPPAALKVPAPMPSMLIPTVPPLELIWSSATSGAFGCVVGPLVRLIAGPVAVMSASPLLLHGNGSKSPLVLQDVPVVREADHRPLTFR